MVLARWQENRQEPLVRRNWIQIIEDLKMVIDFNKINGGDEKAEYTLFFFFWAMQEKTLLIDHLRGDTTINTAYDAMERGSLTGKSKYMMGYIKGAKSSYSVTLTLSDIDATESLYLP